jgi:hypothetical protein
MSRDLSKNLFRFIKSNNLAIGCWSGDGTAVPE